MAVRWFTDADRQDMRNAAEERRVLDELVRTYAPLRVMTAEERAEAIAQSTLWERLSGLRIDPNRRS
ncbi:hypothetical protein [Geodermatophilus poikilotrophus]|uniref:Uncharacterized protein n=1 Tax=Geodermatophilus poikilotrophus TaxID=1333667 RepID=A0A1I0E5Q9_9ACTN|nr:hypothetical protein [Geodermatophilus poikilotrophus]SET40491.1 hypothetical protein SAMN04488546_2364 [Geodermatophilus poikilotrophus]